MRTMSKPHSDGILATVLCTAAFCQLGLAQSAPPVILVIEQANQVQYVEDIADVTRFATEPGVTPQADRRLTFKAFLVLSDIVAINGQAVTGTVVIHGRRIEAAPIPNAGQAIADIVRGTIQEMSMEILTVDGRAIGSIMLSGLGLGAAPPGAPLSQTAGNFTIVGGTGAFLGVRGQAGGSGAQDIPVRLASIAESPANRRSNGGGRLRVVAQLIPLTRPEILTVFHEDFSTVSAMQPARAGEVLIVKATGLGPTIPGINPGQPFPIEPLQPVNSPVAVTVNGQAVEVINSIGWPGLVDTYRVDFRVPAGASSGAAAIQLSAAWIAGSSVNIPIQ